MFLHSLESEGFRNLLPHRVSFHPGVNLLWGENGAGKSNLLEAVYFLFTTCSFRTQRTPELIARGEKGFRLVGEVSSAAGMYRLGLEQQAGKRALVLDGKKAELEDVLERFSVLAFSSRQMEVIGGGPRERRRFLDRGILALRPGYLREMGTFRRTLAQRNRLLQTGAPALERKAWDERFVEAACRIREARRRYCSLLTDSVVRHAGELEPAGGKLEIVYRPSPAAAGPEAPGAEDGRGALAGALERRWDEEQRVGHTLSGPHRDEVRILAGGMDLGRFGSAGQQRRSLLALKVTRMELHREARGELPLLLVDDMDSDLDEATTEALLARVSGGQAFVATCKYGSVRRFAPPARPFRVCEGGVTPGGPEQEASLAGQAEASSETIWKA